MTLPRQTAFVIQDCNCAAKQNHGPLPFIALFGIPAIGSRDHFIYFPFGQLSERHEIDAAPSLLRMLVIFSVGHEVFQSAEKEGTKAPLVAIGVNVKSRFNEIGKKTLRQILGIMPAVALSAKEQINRSPVDRTQLCQRAASLVGTFRATSLEDQRPAGRSEK